MIKMTEDHRASTGGAIPSWSGFIYQGKVAIYHVLRLLCDGKESGYSLKLEYLEDFCIHKDGDVESLHQVKAIERSGISAYTTYIKNKEKINAFEKLRNHANRISCSHAYFHLANDVSSKCDADIEKEYAPVKIYNYHDGTNRCSVDQINNKINQMIEKYYKECRKEELFKNNIDYIERTRVIIDDIIQNKVLMIHAKLHNSNSSVSDTIETMDLSQFKKILDDDLTTAAIDDVYLLCQIRARLREYYFQYIEDQENIHGPLEEAIHKKMADYMMQIENMTSKQVKEFMQGIMPQKEFKCGSIKEYKDNTPSDEGYRHAFLNILKELKKTDFCESINAFIWKQGEDATYYPTTIHAAKDLAEDICMNIVDNPKNLYTLYQCGNLITTGIDVTSVYEQIRRQKYVDSSPERYDRITKWKKVSLVSLSRAKEHIA